MSKINFELINKPELKKAIKKLNRNKSVKKDYFDKLIFAHSEAEKTLYKLEEALRGNILKVKGQYPEPSKDFLEKFLRGE
jgi:hypothetical protein